MQLYAITNRRLWPGGERECYAALLRQAAQWVAGGVNYIQLREKDLPAPALEDLAGALVQARDAASLPPRRTRILINVEFVDKDPEEARRGWEIAARAGADGVHLPSSLWLAARELRSASWSGPEAPLVSVACHSAEQARRASQAGASLALFAPVFEKPLGGDQALGGVGLPALQAACEAAGAIPIFALGGVSIANASQCVAAGAAGVAGIRLFAGERWKQL